MAQQQGCHRGDLPPSALERALKKGLIFMPLRIVYLKSFSNFYKLVQIFDSQEVIIKKNGAYRPYFLVQYSVYSHKI